MDYKRHIKFDTYYKSYPHTESYGTVEPTYALTQTGTNPTESANIEHTFEEELQGNAEPYEYLADAIHAALDLRFWRPAYSPFIVILAPIPITISDKKNTGKLPLTRKERKVDKLASLSPGQNAMLSPSSNDNSAVKSVTVTADHGIIVTKGYRTPIKIPGPGFF